MKEKLENFFKKKIKCISVRDIIKNLGIQENEYGELMNALYELEANGYLIGNSDLTYMRVPKEFCYRLGTIKKSMKRNRYIDLGNGNIALLNSKADRCLKEGQKVYYLAHPSKKFHHQFIAEVVRVVKKEEIKLDYLIKKELHHNYKKNYYYIVVNNKQIIIPKNYLKGAREGDIVTVRITGASTEKIAKVEHIIKRKNSDYVFKVVKENDKLISKSISSVERLDVDETMKENDLLLYKIDEDDNYHFITTLDNLSSEVQAYAKEYGFEVDFDINTLKEANSLDSSITEEEISKRVDLRQMPTVTIDDAHSKDLDDAVSIQKNKDNYILYVSIADVSHYVKPGSYLFESAKNRSTSIYPANSVIPMLPKQLSNDICSLNEGQDRLAKTVKLEITPEGEVIDFNIFSSIIRSNKKMRYNKVNRLLDGVEYDEEYIPYYSMLTMMANLSNILQNRRMNRGFICLLLDEYQYEIDKSGEIENISIREKGQAQLIIENFMLITNEIVAEYLSSLDLNGSFRCHAAPELDSLYKIKYKYKDIEKYIRYLSKAQNPKVLQKILLNLIKDKNEEEIKYISKIMLSSLNRAYYSTENIGHYGLALNNYLTFTSPIRRFPDLLNHLVISAIINGDYNKIPALTEHYEKMCIHSSEQEFLADRFEKNIEAMLLNKYFIKQKDEKILAKVLHFNNDYIFIKTFDNVYGIILLDKSIKKSDEYISLKGYKIKYDDTIYVKYANISESFNEIVFTFIGKENTKILKKERRNNND